MRQQFIVNITTLSIDVSQHLVIIISHTDNAGEK